MVLKIIINYIIKFYQAFVSPLFPMACRYQTSCSENFIYCINKHGVVVGFYFGFSRILCCNSWFGGENNKK